MTSTEDIARRFAKETAKHEMTVLHDDGLYRHLAFRNPKSSSYWFELVTVPGALIFQGDGDTFTFRRLTDMFEFFAGSSWNGKPNLGYWAEKLTIPDGERAVKRYDRDLMEKLIREDVDEAVEDEPEKLAELRETVQYQVIDELTGDEAYDRALVRDFTYSVKLGQRDPDFEFADSWEWDLRDYDWWFLWACQAILWGIAYYRTGKRPEMPVASTEEPAKVAAPETVNGRPVVDVQLPEPVGSEQ